MITDSFDARSPEIILPDDTIRDEAKAAAARHMIDTAIIVFSNKLLLALLEAGRIEPMDEGLRTGSAAFREPIYRIKGKETIIALAGTGAPIAAAIVEELITLFHPKRFLAFGSCGALCDIPAGRLILPVSAVRDEGTSYHYAPAADEIELRGAAKLGALLDGLGVGYVKGKTWTTDAFYRETEKNKDRRLRAGCICVEMECAALQAVCDFRKVEFYQFLYTADSLDGKWDRRTLGEQERDSRLAYFSVAEALAERL